MKKVIEEILERFKDANLASEAARSKIASEILKSLALELLKEKHAFSPMTGLNAPSPAGTPPSGTGRNFIKFDSAGI